MIQLFYIFLHPNRLSALFLTGLLGCSNPGVSTSGANLVKQENKVETGNADAQPKASPQPGLHLEFLDAQKYSNFKVTVVNEEERFALRSLTDSTGAYELIPTPLGRRDLIITAELLQSTSSKLPIYGSRLSGIEMPESQVQTIRAIQLLPTVQLTGKVSLIPPPSTPTIAEVSIPGTTLKTTVKADGTFLFDGVPVGSHDLRIQAKGYHPAYYARSSYTRDSQLPNASLAQDDREFTEGIHYIGAPLAKDIAVTVTCFLLAPSGMDSMRLSTNGDFTETSWQAFRSSLDVDLKEQQRTIYVQFSRERRQLSSVYSVNISAP